MFNLPFNSRNNKFFVSIYWNLFDSIVTQALLIIHNILLQKFIGTYFHGLFSITFSLFYLFIILLNFGLDYSLAPFIKEIVKDKQSLLHFIKYQIAPQIIFISIFSLIFSFIVIKYQNLLKIPFKDIINLNLIFTVALTFISESVKKTLRAFLQLVLMTKTTALVESIGMYFYIATIWTSYIVNINITLEYCWLILLIISIFQVLILSYNLYKYYSKLQNNSNYISNYKYQELIKARTFNWILQMSAQLFNSNFFVPFCSLYLDLHKASYIKIYWSIAQWINSIINKNINVSLAISFANFKDKYFNIFKYLSYLFYQILYSIIIVSLINVNKIKFFIMNNDMQNHYIYIMIFIIFIEPFFNFYEKLFILEKRSISFSIFTLIYITTALLISKYMLNYFSISIILASIIILRLFTIISMSITFLNQKKIYIDIKPHYKTIIFSLILALLYKFLY